MLTGTTPKDFMFLYFLLKFQKFLMWGIIALLSIFQAPIATAGITGNSQANLVVSDHQGSELQLEVRQMPLAQVLDSIAQKTQVNIHYSALPEGLVTATCVGTALKQVLECLLDKKADLIVRYPRVVASAGGKPQISEVWILGSRLDSVIASAECPTTANMAENGSLTLNQGGQEAEADQTDELLKMAQSKNPEERADAIGSLLAGGREGDPSITAVLEQALTDQDANVRAQAVSTLAHREGSAATGILQQAMQDSSVDVRMMAVDGTDDVALLQQASNDSDETIRSLATMKLEELVQKQQ
jgi:hypothetical protein